MQCLAFTIMAVAMLLTPAVQSPERADRIEYYDATRPGRQAAVRGGTITIENAAELVIVNNLDKKPFRVAATEVIDAIYEGEPAETSQARVAEKGRNLERALAIYAEALKKAPADNAFLQAHLRFKMAQVAARLSFTGTAADRAQAIADLQKFRRDFPDARQTVDCLILLAELLLCEEKSVKEVIESFQQLGNKYRDDKEFAVRCQWHAQAVALQEIQELYRKNPEEARKKYADAQSQLAALLPQVDKTLAQELKLLIAECKAAAGKLSEAVADLKVILESAADDRLRASAYLCRGDCYRLNGKHRDAMWDYLWVDVVYNQRLEQNAKALFHLIEVFKAQNDDERERKCRERLKGETFRETRWAVRIQ